MEKLTTMGGGVATHGGWIYRLRWLFWWQPQVVFVAIAGGCTRRAQWRKQQQRFSMVHLGRQQGMVVGGSSLVGVCWLEERTSKEGKKMSESVSCNI